MAKIARFYEFVNEDSKIDPLKDFEYINIHDPKIYTKIKFVPSIHYRYMDVVMHFDNSTSQHMENENLRYNVIFGYGDYTDEGIPKDFDWVAYGKTPEILITELKKMIRAYTTANPHKKTKLVKESEEEGRNERWNRLSDDEKIEKLMKKLDAGMTKKRIIGVEATKIRSRVNQEIAKSGPDKIRMELLKRRESEEEIENGEETTSKGGVSKIGRFMKDQVHNAIWKNTSPFWNDVYSVMSFD